MTEDFTLYVTKVEQAMAPIEDRADDAGVPRVSGGEVVVTAQAGEAFLEFGTTIAQRIAIGDDVQMRIELGPSAIQAGAQIACYPGSVDRCRLAMSWIWMSRTSASMRLVSGVPGCTGQEPTQRSQRGAARRPRRAHGGGPEASSAIREASLSILRSILGVRVVRRLHVRRISPRPLAETSSEWILDDHKPHPR